MNLLSSVAKRANKYLTNDQKEDLLQGVEEAVCQAINKAHGREKRSQPLAVPPPPAQVQTSANYVSQPPPPLVNAATLQLTMNNDFFHQGQVTFDPKTGQQIYQF